MPSDLLLTLLDTAMRGVILALLALLAAVLWRDAPRVSLARIGIALALGMCVQVVGSMPTFESHVPRVWQAPWVAVSVGNAVLFWLFVQALFDDAFRLSPRHVAIWAVASGLGGLNCAFAHGDSALSLAALGVQRVVPLVFAVLALVAAGSQWRADLVEQRRRVRGVIVVTGVMYSLAQLGLRLASPDGRLSELAGLMDMAVMLLVVAVVAWHMLRLGSSDLLPGSEVAPAAPPIWPAAAAPVEPVTAPAQARTQEPSDPADESLAAALRHAMEHEHVYRTESLTVASLAERLSVPEYRLRRLINQQLGHRNFSAFVNGYRLDEVRAALRDPAKRDLPILTLALEAGFQSIGPFNRAFKAATGTTPTEFRQLNMADSGIDQPNLAG